MKVMIAEDDRTSRFLLRSFLQKWGYEVVVAEDGDRHGQCCRKPDAPRLAVLDWMMPGVDGPDLCRRVRACEGPEADYTYLILLTAKTEKTSISGRDGSRRRRLHREAVRRPRTQGARPRR